MVLPMPFSMPQGGEEIVRAKRPYIWVLMTCLVICLPFLFMTQDFTVGSGVMQIFILVFGGLTLWTNDLGQMVPWALLCTFEFIFALVSIILRAVKGPGTAMYGGQTSWVRTKLAYGFEIANAVVLFAVIMLTVWTYMTVKRQNAEHLPINNPATNYNAADEDSSPRAARQTSSFRAFAGTGNTLGDSVEAS